MATQSKQDVIEKFNKGELRYENDEYFKATIIALSYGVGVYAVLDKTLRDHARALAANSIQLKMLDLERSNTLQVQNEIVAARETIKALQDELSAVKQNSLATDI
jgi:hypothetical protein